MTSRTLEKYITELVTTNNIQQSIFSTSVPNNSCIKIVATILGKVMSTGDVVSYTKTCIVKNMNNTISMVGLVVDLVAGVYDKTLKGALVDITLSGTKVNVMVTGIVGASINWLCECEITIN